MSLIAALLIPVHDVYDGLGVGREEIRIWESLHKRLIESTRSWIASN